MGERREVGLMHIARDVSWVLYAAVLVVMIVVLIIVTGRGRCRNGGIGLEAILELPAIILELITVDAKVESGPFGMPPHRGWGVSRWSVVARAGQEQINNDKRAKFNVTWAALDPNPRAYSWAKPAKLRNESQC